MDEPGEHDPENCLEPMQITGTVIYGGFLGAGCQNRVLIRLMVRRLLSTTSIERRRGNE